MLIMSSFVAKSKEIGGEYVLHGVKNKCQGSEGCSNQWWHATSWGGGKGAPLSPGGAFPPYFALDGKRIDTRESQN
jgi:hypothetical protein